MGSPGGIWTAVSGGIAQNQNMDVISNNLANANTVGFKKDEATFKEYLTAIERPPSPVIDIPRTAFKDSDFYHHDGKENAMVNLHEVHTDHTQGHLKSTGSPLDLAIEGDGFFPIQTPQGMVFTRAGSFKMNTLGQIVTADGFPVLGLSADAIDVLDSSSAAPAAPVEQQAPGTATAQATQAAANPFAIQTQRQPAQENAPAAPGQQPESVLKPIILTSGTTNKISISPEGKIYNGKDLLGAFILAEFPNQKGLKKIASTMYQNMDPANVPVPARNNKVAQGFLEQSNVNTVSEIVNLLKANRIYEGNMRAIRTYNDMAGKEANEVGKL